MGRVAEDLALFEKNDVRRELFKALKGTGNRISGLSGYIQNDFAEMLHDGIITKEEVSESIEGLNQECDALILRLDTLRNKTMEFMKSYL